jgi:hypothetical protein
MLLIAFLWRSLFSSSFCFLTQSTVDSRHRRFPSCPTAPPHALPSLSPYPGNPLSPPPFLFFCFSWFCSTHSFLYHLMTTTSRNRFQFIERESEKSEVWGGRSVQKQMHKMRSKDLMNINK